MIKGVFALFLFIFTYAQEEVIEGFFKAENTTFCMYTTENNAINVQLDTESDIKSCVFFKDSTGTLGGACDYNVTLSADNLRTNVKYYRFEILGELNKNFSIKFENENSFEVGYCPTSSIAEAVGTTEEYMAFAMLIAGALVGFTWLFILSFIISK